MFESALFARFRLISVLSASIIFPGQIAVADDTRVRIAPDTPRVEFSIGQKAYVIERNQNKDNVITGTFAKTSRSCPPFCIHPMTASDGVETVGELELINFLKTNVSNGSGLLVDARIPKWHEKGTIPGAVNIPFTLFSKKNPYLDDLLPVLGARPTAEDSWDFSKAKELVLFCNGPWCDQSPRAISGLRRIGYPAEKLFYYRGGIQNWVLLGLSTDVPEKSIVQPSVDTSKVTESAKQRN